MVAWGVDQGWAGGATLINGSPEPTWGGAALSNLFGMSPQTGELLYGLAGFTVAAAGTTLSQLGTVSLKAPTPSTTGVMVGGTQYVESAAIQANTTVRLIESVALANGRVLPKGSIVTVSDDAMKVVLPDGTSSISSYSKAMTPPKALPAPGVTSGGTANAATGAGLNLDLKTTQAANEIVDSLRTTGQLPSNYVTKTVAMQICRIPCTRDSKRQLWILN